MRIFSKDSILIIVTLSMVLSAGLLLAQQGELAGSKNGQTSEDIYKAGGSVQIAADVEGDVVVAGGVLSIANSVAEDVLAAGGMVNITANTGDDIRAAGGAVSIIGNVGHDLAAAGGFVNLESTSTVGGQAWLAGGIVNVAGNVIHDLKVTGGQVKLMGTVGGDVEIYANSIVIEPDAVIKGKLSYKAPSEAAVHASAVIEGSIERQEFDFDNIETWGEELAGSLLFYLSLALSAILLFLAYPQSSANVLERLEEAPFRSLGLGLLVLIVTPIVAILLFVSVVGLPLGIIALTLYFAALIVGLLVGVIWVGDVGSRFLGQMPDQSKWIRVWSIIAAAIVLLLIGFIPYVGGLVFFVVLLLGIGSLKLQAYRLYVGEA